MSVEYLVGDVRDVLPTLDDQSVQCVVTSPPYFGLRDYGVDGQIGLESSVEEYVAEMVAVFAEVRRVLRDDGVLFLNLGDSYNAYNGNRGGTRGFQGAEHARPGLPTGYGLSDPGLKPKDLIGMPWRVAFALRTDGWWLRSDIIWAKPNPMPESVRDRPTKAHEYIFLLTKNPRYFWDKDGAKEPAVIGRRTNPNGAPMKGRKAQSSAMWRNAGDAYTPVERGYDQTGATYDKAAGRNMRSVWTIPTAPFPGAHFATFPPALVEKALNAATRPGDVVLDPFGGAGTVSLVAERLERDSIYIDLNPEYADMARERIAGKVAGLPDKQARHGRRHAGFNARYFGTESEAA